jgi:glycosyltransferase involved in cell wall biosynthesis
MKEPAGHGGRPRPATVAVVIPAHNEAAHLPACLAAVLGQHPDDIVVADGASDDETVAVTRALGVEVVASPVARRARQMNAGAAACSADILLFLCADSRLPAGALARIRRLLVERPQVLAGCFPLRLSDGIADQRPAAAGETGVATTCAAATAPASTAASAAATADGGGDRLSTSLLAASANAFCRLTRTLTCDRAIFVRRAAFTALDGFRDLPVMEDVDFGRRLRRIGQTVVLDGPAVTSSARRFAGARALTTTARIVAACVAYDCGLSADRVAELLYRPRGGTAEVPGRSPAVATVAVDARRHT